jgi:general secretion pathway protein D
MKTVLCPVVLSVLAAGCAAPPSRIPPPLPLHESARSETSNDATAQRVGAARAVDATPQVPGIPPSRRSQAAAAPVSQKDTSDEKRNLEINVDQIPLPVFTQMVFGEMLRTNVQIDPKIAERKDLVTLRTGGPQTPSQVRQLATMLLKSYGIAVIEVGNLVRVVPDGSSLGYLPEIRRGGAMPDAPPALRPAFHLVELGAVRNPDVNNWLRTMFGNRIQVQEDSTRNAVLISGTPDDIAAALEAIRVLDQPVMHGRRSAAIRPSYWSVDDLARRLHEVLSAEGYSVQPLTAVPGQGIRYPIILLPVSAINAVLVFAARDDVLEHVRKWAETLDQPSTTGVGRNFFTYQVRHKDAGVLAATLQQLLSGRAAVTSPDATQAGQGTPVSTAPPRSSTGVVVDRSTNVLIFQGAPEDYAQIRTLLAALDRPSRAALIEVTVAEIQLTDRMQFGVEWSLRDTFSNGSQYTAGTVGGLGIGTSGFTYRLLDSAAQVRAVINALASDNRASILSSPRVMARNGETATIQVGQEVPIVTSQQSSLAGTGAVPTTGVLQTIQYRNTGVILRVKPVVHSSDQIDLDVIQEVSSAEATTTGVNVSPTFGTRKVETKLTLRNGSTVMLAGLISKNSSIGDIGIPGLKDIPVLGQLFRTDTHTSNKTELIVLITPYVISDDHDARAVTDAFRNMLGPWATTPETPAPTPSSQVPEPSRSRAADERTK